MATAKKVTSNQLSEDRVAALAAEIARLDTILAADPDSAQRTLSQEIQRGSPLYDDYLQEDDRDRAGELALLKAKAQLAAHDAHVARQSTTTRSSPPWLTAVLTAFILPIGLAILVPFFTSHRQLTLYREQASHDAMRKQADVLLGQLSSIVVQATVLRNDVAFQDGNELSEGQADILKRTATQLQTDFAAAVRLHSFEAFPELQKTQLQAYYEISALLDCLDQRAGREPSDDWRTEEKDKDVLNQATSDSPCAANFDVNAFDRFKDAVKQNVDERIGGALFPSKTSAH